MRIGGRHSLHRRIQHVEEILGDPGRDLGAEPVEPRSSCTISTRLVRSTERRIACHVERLQRAEVDHLGFGLVLASSVSAASMQNPSVGP